MFTYENQGINSYLVYTLEPGEVIDEVSLGMLANNEIAGVSPIIFNQMNEQKICRFNITAKQTLADFFSRPVKKQQFLTILRNMLNTIMNLDSYLIPNSELLYEMKSIYIDIRTMEIRMICLPIEEKNQEVDLQNFFRNLIFTTNYVQTENCDYVAKLINFFNSTPGFDIPACLELIRSLMKDNVMAQSAVSQQKQPQSNESQHVLHQQGTSVSVKDEADLQKQKNLNIQPNQSQVNQMPRDVRPQERAQKPPINSTIPVPPGRNATSLQQEPPAAQHQVDSPARKQDDKKKGFHLFGKKKDTVQDKPINQGFAIPGQQASYQPIQQQQPRQQARPQPMGQMPAANYGNPIRNQQLEKPPVRQNIPSQNMATQIPQPTVQPREQPRYDFGNTTVLNQGLENDGDTTLLSRNLYSPKPYLIRMKNGEQITIDKTSFRIGRERSYVDYFIGDNSAIGRNHAEIITENSIYYIVDMNSRNHTYVNGVMITSGTRVQIENGAKLRLADEEFEFRYT
jgi:pSer/pThr/pTyr-binding forkhead associated (FHA) protein